MNKKKLIPGLNSRSSWIIKPTTRIHDNDIRKNHKKMRQNAQSLLKQYQEDVL